MKIAISLAALAAGLVASPVLAQQAPAATDAETFLAQAEKRMFDHSIINGRASWLNATYLTDDSDAVASYFGAIDTKMRVE
ncbi:MAG: peptidase M2 family protein, partial [Sphingobium sp.]